MSSEPPCDDIGSAASWMAYMQRFSSSLQRIEGHCDALAAIDQRTSTIMGQVNVVESQIAPILKKQEDMNDLLCQLADRVTAVEQSHLSHHRGSVGGGALIPASRSFVTASTGRGWMCPVCRSGILMSALSLKGHIRRLLHAHFQIRASPRPDGFDTNDRPHLCRCRRCLRQGHTLPLHQTCRYTC